MDRDAVPGALTAAGAQRHVADFAAAFEYLQAKDFVEEGRIAMTGYCFGGGITWQAATDLPGLKATAAFYGPSPTWRRSRPSSRRSSASTPNSISGSPAHCRR